MKLSHNWRGWGPDRTAPDWAARVEAEAQRTTDATAAEDAKRADRIARAEARVAAAMEKLARARTEKRRQSDVRRLALAVEARRAELIAIHREMQATPAGSQHRGKGSHRGVPRSEVL